MVSVAMTCFNGERYIAEAIDSILAQTYAPIEILIVDDGSTDRSYEIAASFGPAVRLFRQEHRGVAAARNVLLHEYQGDFLGLLDADDRFLPHTIERAMTVFAEWPELDAVYFMVREFVTPGVDTAAFAGRDVGTPKAGRLPNTMFVRREMVTRVGDYDTSLLRSQGVDWTARMLELDPKTAAIDDVLLERRLHTDNHGIREQEHLPDYVRTVRAHLLRRRARRREA